MSSVYQPSPNHIAGSGKREARPYPQSLPASGAEACRWLLETMFAGMAGKAWVTLVHDVEAGSQWQGGRLKETKLDFNDESGAYYVAVGIVRAGAAQRLAADIEAVAALVLDDVGDTTSNPDAKLDTGLLELAPQPTAMVETSENNLQAFYVFDEPVAPDDYRALVEQILARAVFAGGIKDGTTAGRYVRLPAGVNVKPGKNRFKTCLREASGRTYTIDELWAAFGPRDGAGGSHRRGGGFGLGGNGTAGSAALGLGEAIRLDDPDMVLGLLEEILAACPNTGIGRDEWIGVVYGIWNASGRNEASHGLAVKWTALRQDGPVDEAKDLRDVWDHRSTADKAGLTSLVRLLEKQNSDQARKIIDKVRSIQAKGAFASITADTAGSRNGTGRTEAFASGASTLDRWQQLQQALSSWPSHARVVNGASGAGNINRLPSGMVVFGKGAGTGPAQERQFITNRLARGIVSVMAGTPGLGKSALAVAAMNAIACERPDLVGLSDIKRAGACVYIAADSEKVDEFKRRDEAFRQHHRLTNVNYRHDILVVDKTGPLVERINEALVPSLWLIKLGKILAEIREAKRLAVIVVDTLSGVAGGGKLTDEADMQAIMDVALILAQELNCAVDLVSHLTKSGAKNDPKSMDAAAGARALTAMARFATNVVREAGGVRLIEVKGAYQDGPTGMDWLEWKEVLIPVEIWNEGVRQGMTTSRVGVLVPVNAQAVQTQREQQMFDVIVAAIGSGTTVLRTSSASGGRPSPRQAGQIGMKAGIVLSVAEADQLVENLIEQQRLAVVVKKEKNGRLAETIIVAADTAPTNP